METTTLGANIVDPRLPNGKMLRGEGAHAPPDSAANQCPPRESPKNAGKIADGVHPPLAELSSRCIPNMVPLNKPFLCGLPDLF